MAVMLRVGNKLGQGGQPLFHDRGDAITHRAGTTVEFGGRSGKEAPPAKYATAYIKEPGVTQFPKTGQAAFRCERGSDNLADKNGTGRIHSRQLQFFLGAKVREQPALAHG